MARKLEIEEDVMCLTADCQQDFIASGYENGHVKLWDTRCESDAPVLSGRCGQSDSDDISSIKMRNDQLYIAAGKLIYHLDVRKVDSSSWTVPRFANNEDDINHLAISDNEDMLAAGDDSNTIAVMDLKRDCVVTHLRKHKNIVYTVEFRPGKPRELITGGYDCMLIHWDVFKSRALTSFDLGDFQDGNWSLPKAFNPSYVLCCLFGSWNSQKASVLLAGTENGNLHCFRCEKKLLHYNSFRAHNLGITDAKYICCPVGDEKSCDRNSILSTGSNDGRIKLWDNSELFSATDPNPIKVIEHGSKINCLSHVQNKFLIVCDTNSAITVLPMQSL